MFHDPTIVGSWAALAARLDDEEVLARWAAAEPDLAGLTTVADLLAVWTEDGGYDRTNAVLAALVRLAAVDGGRDDDALLLTLHLLSGLVWTMVAQLDQPVAARRVLPRRRARPAVAVLPAQVALLAQARLLEAVAAVPVAVLEVVAFLGSTTLA